MNGHYFTLGVFVLFAGVIIYKEMLGLRANKLQLKMLQDIRCMMDKVIQHMELNPEDEDACIAELKRLDKWFREVANDRI